MKKGQNFNRMPAHKPALAGTYDRYPAFSLVSERISLGFDALAQRLNSLSQITVDGYAGVDWDEFREGLTAALARRGRHSQWVFMGSAYKSRSELETLIRPFLGGEDPLFGVRSTLELRDFFDEPMIPSCPSGTEPDVHILYGVGSALANWCGTLLYIDLPKNEIQARSRAGSSINIGASESFDAKRAYKRSYFVDWPVLNRHKASILERIDLFIDGQRPDQPTCIAGEDLREGLTAMSLNAFRTRPWFEPGPWGGQWIKEHLQGLPRDLPNYAWSFELIVPENGLVFESDGVMLEISFDALMFHAGEAVLGESAARFGYDFPIRFDWLDTVQGGNLSLQVHPKPEYMMAQFGEPFTQDETYYILDCLPGAAVYLGLQENADLQAFRSELEFSHASSRPIEVETYVQKHPAQKGDLFLIPSGTVHCSGAGSLVLEISATPYIFTFKLYDWLRLDLEGNPRPLNIARGFDNLDNARAGKRVRSELVAAPVILEHGETWQVVHLPTHEEHFYDVHRLEFSQDIAVVTDGSPHVLCVVEGPGVKLITRGGTEMSFAHAETFVVPAAASSYVLHSSGGEIKVIKAFMKERCK